MSYVVVTHWKIDLDADRDANWKILQEQRFPVVKALGATSVMGVEVSESEGMIIATYADKAVWDAAKAKILELRQKARSELGSELTGEFAGEVKAIA